MLNLLAESERVKLMKTGADEQSTISHRRNLADNLSYIKNVKGCFQET